MYLFANKKISKLVTAFSICLLVINTFISGLIFPGIVNTASAVHPVDDLCQVAVDVVLVMDRSGSMADGQAQSKCVWTQLDWVGTSFQCVEHTENNLTQEACLAKPDPSQCGGSPVFYPATKSKINNAKDAANSFLNNMGASDQSALVSFSDLATLDKALSDNHANTKTAVNNLSPIGSTNIGDAIGAGIDELNSARSNPQATKAMILLTDGKANKPNGNGSGENPDDVQYAIDKATEAAGYDYKIFTVGLGSNGEINESMLQEIATVTGGNYHHAPNGSDLTGIYDEIAWELCQYGSISGCKYNDLNNNGAIDLGEPTIADWIVELNNGTNDFTQTTIDGCYTFAGLQDGDYTVSEEIVDGWLQTYPADGFYMVNISGHNDVEDIDFANYFPACDNGMLDSGEVCEIGDSQSCVTGEGYDGIESCDAQCAGWGECVSQESCGDGIKNGNEECDGSDGVDEHYQCAPSCILEYVPWCGDLIQNNNEECDGDADLACEADGYAGFRSCDQCAWSQCQASEYCGDGAQNGPELCDSGNQSCMTTDGYDGTQICNSSCDGWENCETQEYCGDSVINGNEECDDGNIDDGDGCSSLCLTESFPPDEPVCGDGVQEGDEECDDGNLEDGDGCSAACTIEGIAPGDVVINEIMQNPDQVDDFSGEWFELYNNSNKDLDLIGCVISDNGTDSHTISSVLNVQSGVYVIFGRSYNNILNGGISPDYVYSGITLGNADDEIILTCNGTEIDRAEYDGGPNWPDPAGKSMILANPNLDNNIGVNWCESTSAYGAGDLGTPGAQNDVCGGITCEASETSRECVSDGYATVYYSWNDESCGNAYSQEESDGSCACIYSEWTAGDCVSSSERQWTRENLTQYSYCADTTKTEADASCASGPTPGPGELKVWKYLDLDGNVSTLGDQTTLPDWSFTIDLAAASTTATTTQAGYAIFSVAPGDHTVTETVKNGWYLINDELQGHSFSVPEAQTVEVKYYNAEYAAISGYKYEDIDGIASTTADIVGKSGWTVSLYDMADLINSVATTTTDANGYFAFTNLKTGSYRVVEEEKTYWTAMTATSTDFVLTSGTATSTNFINHYNGPQGYIFGCKYDDANNNGGLDSGEKKLGGVDITLEKEVCNGACFWQAMETKTTETDSQVCGFGCYKFEGLESGNYRVSEEPGAGWAKTYPSDSEYYEFGLDENAPTTTIDFYNYYQGYCGDNIKNNGEECDGADGAGNGYDCSSGCVLEKQDNSCGGGGFTARADIDFSADYAMLKYIGETYSESLVVSNSGNIILTNGVLTIDLPEEKIGFGGFNPQPAHYYQQTETAEWQIDALGVGRSVSLFFDVIGRGAGSAVVTDIKAVFDQTSGEYEFAEDIAMDGVGGEPAEETAAGGTGATGGAGQTGGATAGTAAGAGQGEVAGIGAPEIEEEIEGETSSAATTAETGVGESEVAGVGIGGQDNCADLPWWPWLAVIVLHVIGYCVYYYFLSTKDFGKPNETFDLTVNSGGVSGQPRSDIKKPEEPDKFTFNGSWQWMLIEAVLLVIIFLLLTNVLSLNVLALVLVLAAYFGALIAMHWLLEEPRNVSRMTNLAVLVTLAPVIVLIFCQGWSTRAWLAAIVLYALAAVGFYAGKVKKGQERFKLWMAAMAPITLLMFFLEYLIYWCACL